MQQTTAQQLKYYGRRNRAKQKAGRSEQVFSPGSEDASSAHVDEPAASPGVKLQDVIRVSGHPEISPASKEWASKPVATSEEEVTPGSDVVKRQMPTTRKNSAIKSPANQGREATREATTGKQVSALEGVSAKKAPEKVQNEEMVIVGIASNGGQEQHGKPKKGAVPVCAGARKARAQLARDEARRLAGEGQPSQESHDVATSSMVAHHRQEALERRRRVHQVLAKANAIWSKREFIEANKDKKPQPKSKEPSRSKPHWDFVLEEMTWLAKDFERERKWKLAQAKKVALRVSRSKLDFEAREIRHQKEEEQRVRRVASGIAKEVKKFWMKVEKLVTYKQQLQIEERKKKALDKHLDFLLGQTERYSTMLAANLADPLVVSDHQSIHLLPPVPLEDDAGAAIGEELYLVSQADVPSKDSKVNDEGRNKDRSVNMDLEGDDEDFILNDEEEQEDDEATLEADEALITEAERTEELGALQRESELPMEELLKIYKTKRESMEQDEEETTEGETDKEQEDDGENDNEDEEVDVDDKDLMTIVRADVAEESRCNIEHAWTVGNEAQELTGSSLNIKDTTNVKSEIEDDSHRQSLCQGDDESTLEEEERQAKEEDPSHENEVRFLRLESEMTLEELLAKYKSFTGEHDQDKEDANDDLDDFLEDRQDRTSEAGTSGSSDEEEEDHLDNAHYIAQANARMGEPSTREDQGSRECLADAAAAAQSAQPTGYTYSTTKVRTNLPFLLKHSLREYQHIGLDWLVTMYEKRLNGILADEMGLGKTIMTIALLAHLACEKGIWGPHLIVVPTSVMLNWETEFMKWCPAFKILTYFGSAKERKLKRQGWSRTNSFHVCITTYRLVIQDAKAFKRKKWKYLILDEAHLIKNWKSQRWQTLLNFNSKRRILLTGTPLQNDLMELWSLMHFLMPHVFQSHQEFRDWFSNPITGMVEGQEQVNKELVDRLHNVLRPFLLRRLKKDVEKQLPGKFEHVIHCRLSKRQRNLYEDFMASSDTQETLASGNFLGLINVLMQLRKVCNHPDLFEGRPIISSFDMPGIELHLSSAACSALTLDPLRAVGMESVNGYLSHIEHDMALWEAEEVITMKTPAPIIVELASSGEDTWKQCYTKNKPSKEVRGVTEEIQAVLRAKREKQRKERMLAFSILNDMRCSCRPVYGSDLRKLVEVEHPVHDVHKIKANHSRYLEFSSIVADIVKLPLTRCKWMMDLITAFVFAIPAARAPWPSAWCSHPSSCNSLLRLQLTEQCSQEASIRLVPLRPVVVRRQLFFPDRRLLQFDCGKLQELAVLLRRLKSEGHRALIFTQMTKMLDVLEGFISLYGYTYMRLDGSTKPEQRQILMQRFNTNPKIFLFILSTRSGGVGINLVGADTVIFYDSDWNPAMDQQAQDRCHRIGQTREVHIYRLVSESTIEENILKKANQKRILDDLVIQSGSYNTEFFKKLDPMELFSGLKGVKVDGSDGKAIGTAALATAFANNTSAIGVSEQRELSVADVEAALKNAEDEADYMAMKQVEQEEAAENQEFTEEGFAANIDEEDLADDTEEAGRGGVNPGMVQFESMEVAGTLRVEQGSVEGLRTTVAEESTFAGTSLLPADVEEDMDMLADVRQMAAAAAAEGREKTSFEDQLRPVERFAMRFLELWDPRAENLAVVAQVAFEEKEWELDQLEKLKEEQEAEMDEENEPLSYENWDTAFANQAYRQQVEVLAQQQVSDLLVSEAAATVLGAENFSLKSKGKKAKKAKFKSLAEGSLLTAAETEEAIEEYSSDPSYRDSHSDQSHLPHRDPSQRKRMAPKLLEEELLAERHLKKLRREQSKEREVSMEKVVLLGISFVPQSSESLMSFEGFLGGKKKAEGTVSIMGMHPKKGPVVMLEKEKKKDVVKSLEHVPQAAPWVNAEDAVLCAVVHEYGGNWLLASETLAAIPEGGIYRGRHRHPVHCRERFRQLLAQNIAAATGDPSSEKSALHAASNVQLKVTEEHTKRLLDVVQTLPDDELLLPRHFVALLSVVQAQKNVTGQQGPVKLTVPVLLNSPRQQPSVPLTKLHRSYRDEVLFDRLHSGRPNPGQVLAALIESEKSETKVASAPANLKQLMPPPKDLASSIEDESFSIKDFLVGFTDGTAQPSVSGGSEPAIVQSERPLVSIEDLLGIPIMFPVHPIPTKAVRHVAELLVDQRYRLATKMGLEGSGNEWAAAAGSLTGVVGVQVPTKSKNTGKKRPASDPNKPPKPKQPHIPKPGKKKEAPGKSKSSDMASHPPKTMSVMRKKDLSAHNGAATGSLSTSSAISGQHPAVPRKLPSTIRKTVLDATVDTGLLGRETPGSPKDLEGVQAPGFVESPSNPPEGNQNDMTVSKSKKSKISVARPGTEGGEKPPTTKEKRPTTPKKLACASQNRDLDSAASSGIATGGDGEYLGSSMERRIDLNDLSSSDDDVTITGVIPGGAAGRSEASNAPQSQLQLASSALEGLQPKTAMPRQVVGTASPGIRTLRDEFRSPFLSDDIRYSSLRDGAVGTSLLKKHPQSLGGIGSDLQIGLPLTLRGSLMAPGTVGHTESSSSLASAFGNVSLSTKRSDWLPVSASSGWEPFSSLPDFLPMEPSQLQHDPPPLGVWPNPTLVDLESPVQNLRKLSDNVAKRSPSNGAGFIRHEVNRTSGGVSTFQLRCEPAVALGSISPSVVIGSRVADIGAPMIQLRKSTLDNQIQELPDLEMVVNEQHLQSLGNLASRSVPQMQAQSLFSAGFPSASISRGGGNLTQHPFSFAPAAPQFPFSTSPKIGQQHLYSSGSQNVELPPDFWPSSSVSFPKQQLYNYQHQHSGEALPTFVGAPVVDQEVSIDLGLSLGPGVPEKQPGARLP
ncbi:unnamed protein product [Sphagnum troendelagicum]|uniref:Uncharacterized protein n=1 Tax=Sphagnum troendelagicum TaxID=128251 RepID=A0ABP0USI7_9BRYO